MQLSLFPFQMPNTNLETLKGEKDKFGVQISDWAVPIRLGTFAVNVVFHQNYSAFQKERKI